MMRPGALLPALSLLIAGAAPTGSFTTSAPVQNLTPTLPHPVPAAPPRFTDAPTPNQDTNAPHVRATGDASVTPGFFSRRDQYRGEGLSAGSSAQTEQDRRAKPGAGINLTMPLQ